jgi:hypothetical protein
MGLGKPSLIGKFTIRRTMPTYTFTTPYVEETPPGVTRGVFAYLLKIRNGISIGKSGGVYFQKRYPNQDDIDTYTEFYAGGHKHSVTEAVKAALIAANIGVTESNFTVE